MRHVFFVHSYITYLVGRQVITHERLTPADCLLLLLRGFAAPADCPIASAPIDAVTIPFALRFWQVWAKVAALDRRIDELTGGADFTLYAPHTDNSTVRLLYTHPRCRAICYVEEGLASYTPRARWRKPYSFVNHVLRRLYSRGRYPELQHFEDFYQKAYCVSDHCFPGMPRKVVLPIPFHQVHVEPNPSGQAVLVLDAVVEFGVVAPPLMRQALQSLLDWLLGQGRRQILYKYHPVQARDPARRVFYEQEVFGPYRDRLEFVELPAALALEELAVSYSDVLFAIMGSSVGLYAAFSGQRVVSVAKQLAAVSDQFAARMTLMPPVFFEVIEFLPAAAPVA